MDIFDEIIANLELEKELGVRTVEIDRALLLPPKAPAVREPPPREEPVREEPTAERRLPVAEPQAAREEPKPPEMRDMAFLTAGAFSAEGEALLAKMIQSTGRAPGDVLRLTAAPFAGGARVAVVMGADALRLYAPGARAPLGGWTTVGRTPAVVTYSPDRLLRFFGKDPAKLREGKLATWNALKEAMRRIENAKQKGT